MHYYNKHSCQFWTSSCLVDYHVCPYNGMISNNRVDVNAIEV